MVKLDLKREENYRKKHNLEIVENSSQGRDNEAVLIDSSEAQKIIRNCVAFCAWSGVLEGTLLQKQAKSIIESKGVEKKKECCKLNDRLLLKQQIVIKE